MLRIEASRATRFRNRTPVGSSEVILMLPPPGLAAGRASSSSQSIIQMPRMRDRRIVAGLDRLAQFPFSGRARSELASRVAQLLSYGLRQHHPLLSHHKLATARSLPRSASAWTLRAAPWTSDAWTGANEFSPWPCRVAANSSIAARTAATAPVRRHRRRHGGTAP